MRRLLLILLPLLLAIGCRERAVAPPNPPGAHGDQVSPPTDGLWKPSLTGVQMPDAPATGQIGGAAFQPDDVRFDATSGRLSFSRGLGSAPDQQLILFLFDRRTDRPLSIAADASGSQPQVHLWWTAGGTRQNEAIVSGYSLELRLDAADGKVRRGAIYLCLPDASSSVLAGRFEARITP